MSFIVYTDKVHLSQLPSFLSLGIVCGVQKFGHW